VTVISNEERKEEIKKLKKRKKREEREKNITKKKIKTFNPI